MRRLREAKYLLHARGSRDDAADDMRRILDRIHTILNGVSDSEDLPESRLEEIDMLLDQLPPDADLLAYHKPKCWNIFQQAVIRNQPMLCEILINRGCDVNNAGIDKGQKCTPPLHLAAKLGFCRIVQLLLDYGARADQSRCVCFPRPLHYMLPQHVRRKPILHALPQDRVEVVRTLLTHRSTKALPKSPLLLHEACKARAQKSAELIVSLYPEQVNCRDSENLTPLHYCLKGIEGFHRSGGLQRVRDGKAIAVTLLNSGARFAPDAFHLGDKGRSMTYLHILYDSEDRTDIYKLTRVFLANGQPDLVSQATDDSDGDTPLHRLLKSFGRRQTRTVPDNTDMYVRETICCIRLLLVWGCDLNYSNKRGETALHSLLSPQDETRHPLEEKFGYRRGYPQFLFNGITAVSEVLLKMGADPNQLSPPACVSPFYNLISMVCASSTRMIYEAAAEIKACIRLFCEHGANLQAVNLFDENALMFVLAAMGRWLNNETNEPYILELLRFVYDVVEIFVSHGLEPASVLTKNLKQLAIMLWSPLVHEGSMPLIIDILKLVIRSGGDPNRSALYTVDQTKENSTLFFICRAFVWHSLRQNEFMVDILRVFENTVSHRNWMTLLSLTRGWLREMKPHASCLRIIRQIIEKQIEKKGHRRNNDVKELYLANSKLVEVHDLSRYKNLRYLWLNGNKLRSVKCLAQNLCLSELYLHENRLVTLTGALGHLTCLEVLFLHGNELEDLPTVVDEFKKMQNLRVLNLFGNPVSQEDGYRIYVIHHVPSVELLDRREVLRSERETGVTLYREQQRAVQATIAFGRRIEPPRPRPGWSATEPAVSVALLAHCDTLSRGRTTFKDAVVSVESPPYKNKEEAVHQRALRRSVMEYSALDWSHIDSALTQRTRPMQEHKLPQIITTKFR